jgi:tetratricopeptide (TPR) repeat protein
MAIELTLKGQANEQSHDKKSLGQLFFNVGSIERYLGNISVAEANLDKAIELNAQDHEAWLLRSSLRKQRDDSNHVEQLQAQLQQRINPPLGHAQMCYALAKELEDIGRYAQSFDALSKGAALRRKYMQYDPDNDNATIDKIIEVFDETAFTSGIAGHETQASIFILGLPRTGSTLVERIIGSHSEVHSAGELNNFALQMMAQVKAQINNTQQQTKSNPRLQLVAETRRLDFAQLGESYVNSERPETNQARNFIDKLPLNLLYAGLIHLALPQAKIVHVKRHPLDTCYAIYKQLFTHGYPFSYDLNELADYYIAHHGLMTHWHKVMPGVIYEVSYEAIVEDVEGEAKALIEYCGLPWQPDCSMFQNNAAPSTTASASQVRQGIYTSSKHRWLQYQAQLTPLKNRLEQAGICCEIPTATQTAL